MEALVWTLIVLGDLATAVCAVHLTRRHRRDAAHLVRFIHRAAPVLLAAGLLPLPALLAADASAAAWGLWGATSIVAALVYAYADTLRDLPPHARDGIPGRERAVSGRERRETRNSGPKPTDAPHTSVIEPARQSADRAALEATGVEKTYRRGLWPASHRIPVLKGVDLTLAPGEVVGLVGENGSGKSTLMKILVGALAADAGTVTRSGRLGYCPQEPIVYERLTCDEHFELFGRAYRLPQEAERRSRKDIYTSLGFERYAATRADQLSGGTLSKLNLGLALLADPEVLLLDEPYAGFDFDTYLKFWDLVGQRRQAGRSVLIISHFVTDQERFDRIVQLRDGRAVPR